MAKLVELFSPTIETAINQVIQLDPLSKERLSELDNKVIQFELTDINQKLYFIIEDNYILVKACTDNPISAELSGTSFAFFNLALSQQEQGQKSIFTGQVRFAGEIQAAQQFQSFFEQLDIDWEEIFSKYTGDIVAHQLFKQGKSLHNWALEAINASKNNISEYLRYESRSTPASIELENFYDEVADLKSDLERLSLRIERLYSRQNAPNDKA